MNGGASSFGQPNRTNYRRQQVSDDVTMTDSNAAGDERSRYWRDDFRPLRDAGKNVLRMLRRDETSAHGDLYRRIMSQNPRGSRIAGLGNRSGNGASDTGRSPTIREVGDAEANPAHRYFAGDDGSNPIAGSDASSGPESVQIAGPFKHSQTIPLPPYLQEVRSKAKVSILMGLFPDAELAWMTTDDTVYLWTYHQNSANTNGIRSAGGGENQFLEFRVPSRQPIVSVGLAPPKKGALQCVDAFVDCEPGLLERALSLLRRVNHGVSRHEMTPMQGSDLVFLLQISCS